MKRFEDRAREFCTRTGTACPDVSGRLTPEEELSLTAVIMSNRYGLPVDDCIVYVGEVVAADDCIDFNEIDQYFRNEIVPCNCEVDWLEAESNQAETLYFNS